MAYVHTFAFFFAYELGLRKMVVAIYRTATRKFSNSRVCLRDRGLLQQTAQNSGSTEANTTTLEVVRARDPFDKTPRQGALSWDEYFMAIALLSAKRSKDPNKQVGACIVNPSNIILGIGYNGFPRGCPDHKLSWAKKSLDGVLGTKYPFVVHAEANALLNTNHADLCGSSIYVTMFPCNECAKLLIQAGIQEVIFHEAKLGELEKIPADISKASTNADAYEAAHILFNLSGVRLRQFELSPAVSLQ